ncbi:2-keto-4-pentenoate hydratase/2-oxohepta-3-ene-1,7-dioic acid hydratase (catechol pathway) [Fontibacillus panacisegetis]|uniref:2-keto-4-pentenoate hydratase/2-oxohepta-3-ene-1,7-dioic acid hydratase (Catechol pathway) n=1 Tax=Fontibacillus panacisegetis TaxID=670482 RepID=A0A1G7MRQ3_9BACL|nr:fumarylacetoacetate hydrolase family protein [Fontibacillus panacisegetis]SDF64518.1 2-keto-4-pentenoate hydratase/2-oxohepta-3-ene-1,7-dioic acid hydratase (catechol pathway) [Fontibacillus panacisegetis]
MSKVISNVYCVGRNYRLHAEELGNEVPSEPMIFMKPSHAVVSMNEGELVLPENSGEVHYEAELVIRIGRRYEPGMTVDELVDVMALGIDFTLRDVQSEIKKKGHPWTAAKGFRNSAPITPYIAFPGIEETAAEDFTLLLNENLVQRGNISDMIFSLQQIVDYVGERYGLDEGDHIFTGTPAGVGPIYSGDKLELSYGSRLLGSCEILKGPARAK